MAKNSKGRGRSAVTYNHKLDRLKVWYAKREEARKTWSAERVAKTKPLAPLADYVSKLKGSAI